LRKPAMVVGLMVVCSIVAVAGYLLLSVGLHVLSESSHWLDREEISVRDEHAGILFFKARDAGLIRLKGSGDELDIEIADCSQAKNGRTALSDQTRALLDSLCTSEAGEALQREIADWRTAKSLVAVRDDATDADQDCRPPAQRPLAAYYLECKSASWQIGRLLPSGEVIDTRRGQAPALGQISAFGRSGLQFRFHEWVAAKTTPDLNPARTGYRFFGTLPVGGRLVHIQVAGRLLNVTVAGIAASARLDGATLPGGGGLAILGVHHKQQLQDESGDIWEVDTPCDPPREMTCLVLRSSRPVAATIVLDVAPLPSLYCRTLKGESCEMRAGGRLAVICTPSVSGRCHLDWKEIDKLETRGEMPCLITDRSGIPLIDGEGDIVPAAREAGLEAVIGLGPEDSGSLIASVVNGDRRRTCHVRTTISLAAQRAVQAALNEIYESDDCHCKKANSRGEIIILDDDTAPGEVLAVANWPAVPRSPFHVWDVAASAGGGIGRNHPLRQYGWQETDPDNMPGSMFKVFTAVAAINRVAQGDAVVHSLLSGADKATVVGRFDIQNYTGTERCDNKQPTNQEIIRIPNRRHDSYHCTRSVERETLDKMYDAAPACRTVPGKLDLCEALAISSNIWFAGLETMIDGGQMLRGPGPTGWGEERNDRIDTLELRRAVDRLIPFGTRSPTAAINLMTERYHPQALRVDPVSIEAEAADVSANRRVLLSQAGFGQNVVAPPLQLAAAYASIGCGSAVIPHLEVKPIRNCATAMRVNPLVAGWTPQALEDYELLRRGLQVSVTNGTAAGQFNDAIVRSGRLHVKTGTATPNAHIMNIYSSGLAGWFEPAAHPGSKRIAFICKITWTKLYGARACGKVMNELLAKFDEDPHLLHPQVRR
jgi:cell division protein FtsI/penicillin-binding protein 2